MDDQIRAIEEYVYSRYIDPAPHGTLDEAAAVRVLDAYYARPENAEDPDCFFPGVLYFELGFEDEYLERIAELEARVADGTATPEDERDLAGVKLVLEQWTDAMPTVAALKGEDVIDELDDLGAPNGIEWAPAGASKGTTALQILTHSR